MLSIVETIVAKLVSLLIGYLWKHHEQKMEASVRGRREAAIQQAQEASVHAQQQASQTLVEGAAVVSTIAHAGSLRAGSDALNAELNARN